MIKKSTKLFDHQKEQMALLMKRRKVLFVEKTGKGKTLTCLSAFSKLKQNGLVDNLLVLSPRKAYESKVWEKDILKFTHLKYLDVECAQERKINSTEKLGLLKKNIDVFIGKHTHLRTIPYLLKSISQGKTIIVVDEIHAFKNPNSKVTRLFRSYFGNNFALWGLTATPLSKNMEDTYNIINLIRPGFLGNFVVFKRNYCIVKNKIIGRLPNGMLRKVEEIVGIKNTEEFEKHISSLVVLGSNYEVPNFYYIDYELNEQESNLYKRIAYGLTLNGKSSNSWLTEILGLNLEGKQIPDRPIKEINRHSSRFIYLQSASDGILDENGNQSKINGTKTTKLVERVREIVSKGESVAIYFDYHASLDVVKSMLIEANLNADIHESTGKTTPDETKLNEGRSKIKSQILLATRAASESISYFYFKHAIFFHIPTTPISFTQFVGRITRINTLFPGDLQVGIMRANTIDLYKLYMVSYKSYQMELVSGKEENIPEDYKIISKEPNFVENAKKLLLWSNKFI